MIGFVGAPFTMASYMIEGGPSRNFLRTKQMMYRDETLWRRLMGKLVDVLGSFAVLQVAAGARIIQVFDSWVGALGPDDYVRFVAPYSRALIERIRAAGVPVIHFGTGAAGFLPRTARGRRRRDGRRLAHQHRSGLDGHQLPFGDAGQSGSGGAVGSAAGAANARA